MTEQRFVVLALVALGAYVVLDGGVDMVTLTGIAAFIPAVIFHEVSHAVSALAFGDDTAKRAGRVTLNPIPHIDPFGSLILPAMMAFATAGGAVFGYAKPVPVNPRRMRSPRNHSLLVSLAGPVTNIVLAVGAAFAFRMAGLSRFDIEHDALTTFVAQFGAVNVILAVFNLLPIPPLDGSAMVERVLPTRWWEPYLRYRQYSFAVLLVLVFGVGLDWAFDPVLRLWTRLL